MNGISMLVPTSFGRVDGRAALKDILEGKPTTPAPVVQSSKSEEYFYEPKNRLEFERTRSCLGASWTESHYLLQQKGWRMPTIGEFMTLIQYLADHPSREGQAFLNDAVGYGPNAGTWLDNQFEMNGKKDVMYSYHLVRNVPELVLIPRDVEYIQGERLKNKFNQKHSVSPLRLDHLGIPESTLLNPTPFSNEISIYLDKITTNGVAFLERCVAGTLLSLDMPYDFKRAQIGTYACREVKP